MKERRVGLFGGSFNPIHIGHLTIAEEALRRAELDEVVFIPAGNPYFKDPGLIAPGDCRFEMTRLAAEGLPGRFSVSRTELDRAGPSYTWETTAQFRKEHPSDRLFLILGGDTLFTIASWREPARIFADCEVLAVTREGLDEAALREKARELEAQFGARVTVLGGVSLPVSSTEVRRLIREGHAFRWLVTPPVADYIEAHHLYKEDDA